MKRKRNSGLQDTAEVRAHTDGRILYSLPYSTGPELDTRCSVQSRTTDTAHGSRRTRVRSRPLRSAAVHMMQQHARPARAAKLHTPLPRLALPTKSKRGLAFCLCLAQRLPTLPLSCAPSFASCPRPGLEVFELRSLWRSERLFRPAAAFSSSRASWRSWGKLCSSATLAGP